MLGHVGLSTVGAQKFFGSFKVPMTRQVLLAFVRCETSSGALAKVLFRWLHKSSGGFAETLGERFSRPVELASHGVGGLVRQVGDLFIAELFVSDEQ